MLIKIWIDSDGKRKDYHSHDYDGSCFVINHVGDMRQYGGGYDTLAEAEQYTLDDWNDDNVYAPREDV